MYFSTLVAFAVLPFLVGAIPVSPKTSRAKGIRSIPLTKRSVTQSVTELTEARYNRAFYAYEKRTGKTHPLASKRRNEPRFVSTNFTVSNMFWAAEATIGTPAVSFNMLIDTADADTWISGINCPNCTGHNTFDNGLSSTATDAQILLSIGQLAGSVTGEVVSDIINIGGGHVNTTFLVASDIPSDFQAPFPTDGSVGFAMKKVGFSLSVDSWFDGAVENGDTEGDDVVGLTYSSAGSGPQLIFGGTDTSKIAGSLTYIKVTANTNLWEIPLDSVTVNGNDITITLNSAIISSGIVFIEGSPEDITNLHNNIPGSAPDPTNPGSGLFTVPCNSTAVVALTFGGQAFPIAPDVYVQGPSPVGPGLCNSAFVGISSSDDTAWFLGAPFIQSCYVELDHKNLQVGLGVPM